MLLGLAPVSLFLVGLLFLDSYKLVRFRWVLLLVGLGGVSAGISYVIHRQLLDAGTFDHELLRRLVAPALEEFLKGLTILVLLRARRIGFLIDAGILGFALGGGFALVENLYYLWALPDSPVLLWAVRGLGTAVMHGGTTAILAMTTKAIMERKESKAFYLAIPGLTFAFGIHATFNQFLLTPLVSALLVILIVPTLMMVVFEKSESSLRTWLGTGFDLDEQLLESMRSGDFISTRAGRYLQSLKDQFEGPVVADMLCYLRLHAELSLKAKTRLILQEAGISLPKDPEVADSLQEMAFLKKSIGPTGELALSPIVQRFTDDAWQHQLLDGR